MQRRILLIVLVLLVLIGIGVAIYFFFFAPRDPGITTGDPTNPFGTAGEYPGGNTVAPEVGVIEGGAGEEIAPRLVKITDGPVAFGSLALAIEEEIQVQVGTTTATTTRVDTEVRYVERASGNVYAYRVGARTLTRLTNRTLPRVEEAVWTPGGGLVFLRFLSQEEGSDETIESYALPVGSEGGFFLEAGLAAIVSNGPSVLTQKVSDSGSVGTIARTDGSNPRTLFSSVLSSLRIYPSGANFAAHTKASAHLDGYGFLINGTNGSFERILGPSRGLTVLPSPSGRTVLYGSVAGTRLESALLNMTTRETIALPLGALPEKCTWTLDESSIYCAVPRAVAGVIPDDWYQGATSFSDRIWRIDLTDRVASLVFDPALMAEVEVDAVNLSIDETASVLVFTNRKDGSLWTYDL